MSYLLRGALVEYGSEFLGPLPNVVIFQFNPESLSREIRIPSRPTGASAREQDQAGERPVESFSIAAHFSAADQLGEDDPLARRYGIGPRLASLESMVRPRGRLSEGVGAVVDAVAALLGSDSDASQPIPRERYPRVLFVWGMNRILPVVIESLTINEQEYDAMLNPVRAEVTIGVSVLVPGRCSDDQVARGAYEYSDLSREVQAAAYQAAGVRGIIDRIPF